MAAQHLEQQEDCRHIATIVAMRKYSAQGHHYKLRFKLQAEADQAEEEFRSFSQAYNRALDLGYIQYGEKRKDNDHLISIINAVHQDFDRNRKNFSERVLLLLSKSVRLRHSEVEEKKEAPEQHF